MTTADFFRHNNTYHEGARWAVSVSNDMANVWDAMIREKTTDLLIWTARRVFDAKTIRLLAVRLVRETPGVFALLADPRLVQALVVAERFANGKATEQELAAAEDAARTALWFAAGKSAGGAAWDTAGAAAAAAWQTTRPDAGRACAGAQDAADAAVHGAALDAHQPLRTNAQFAAIDAARLAAQNVQVQIIADLGNPFRAEREGILAEDQATKPEQPATGIAARVSRIVGKMLHKEPK